VSRPTASRSRSVFAPVTALSFNSAQKDDCRQFLAQRAADTECVPIVDEAQLVMAADGRIAENGYRFNAIGFSAVANAMISGLNPVFNDLTGESRNSFKTSLSSGDLATAVSIYNMALKARFDNLRERTLLVNHREKTVDGFLGLEHRMLDNAVFFTMGADELESRQPDSVFYRAELIGRELRLYFVDNKTKRNNLYHDPRHIFAAGWYFSNREDSGLAVRASLCVTTKFGAAVASKSSSSAVRHTGADLIGRAAIMIGKLSEEIVDMDAVARGVSRLASTSLNYSESAKSRDAAMSQLVERLGRFKISRDDARQICKNAATVGADLDPRNPMDLYSREVLASRTMYDLFCSILRYSRNQYHTTRDLLQSAAMEILLPKKER
jgi:hypothetical protein